MDTAQWPQEILVKPMEEMIPNTCSSSVTAVTTTTANNNTSNNSNNNSKPSSTSLERKVRPQKDHAVNCPRCNSTNTKFCYYNNYSLTQPRYFCKTCRRYWTEGGSLRNIPVGGGSRKNKRTSSSSSLSSPSSCSASKKMITSHDLVASAAQQAHHFAHQNPKIHHQHHNLHLQGGQDLNLGFPQQEFRSLSEFMQLPTIETTPKTQIPNSGATPNSTTSNAAANHHLSNMELLTGLASSRGLTPFMPMPVLVSDHPNGGSGVYTSGFSLQDYKPSLNFSLVDGLGNGYGSLQGEVVHHHHQQQQHGGDHHQTSSNGRLLFPFEDLKQVSSTTSADHNTNNNSGDNNNTNNNSTNNKNNNNNHDQNGEQGDDSTPGYWSGMLGTGGSW